MTRIRGKEIKCEDQLVPPGEEQRHCGKLLGGNQNKIFSHVMKILRGLGKFLFCSVPIMSSLKAILVCPLKKRKNKTKQNNLLEQ